MNQLSDKIYLTAQGVFDREKEDWIFLHGSKFLQHCFLSGYPSGIGYLEERIAIEYPGFKVSDSMFYKADTPSSYALNLSLHFDNSYCASCLDDDLDNYLVVDRYLGKYTIVKKINPLKLYKFREPITTLRICVLFAMVLFIGCKTGFLFEETAGRLHSTLNDRQDKS
jgi:hypothetical protein